MKCKDIQNKLFDFTEGNVSENERKNIQNHFLECKTCNSIYINIKASLNIISKEKTTENNPFFYKGIQNKLKNNKKRASANILLKQVYEFSKIAAIIAIGIFLGILIGNTNQQTNIANQEDVLSSEFYFDDNELAYESVEDYLIDDETIQE